MLQVASLTAAAERLATKAGVMVSPSKNMCRVRVKVPANVFYCYRNDPYNCRLFTSPVKAALAAATMPSPVKPAVAQPVGLTPVSSPVPLENRLLHVEPKALPRAVASIAPVATADAHEAPAAPEPKQLLLRFAFVKFKYDSITYVAPFKIVPGEYVMVEGDRGEHIGIVEEITTVRPTYPVPCKILRRASRKEKELLFGSKKVKESTAKKSTQQLADSLGLSIKILDTEFQYDNNKLTVFFTSKQNHIDFRKLQRGLFREYRCRIWLTNMAELEAQAKLPRCR